MLRSAFCAAGKPDVRMRSITEWQFIESGSFV